MSFFTVYLKQQTLIYHSQIPEITNQKKKDSKVFQQQFLSVICHQVEIVFGKGEQLKSIERNSMKQ